MAEIGTDIASFLNQWPANSISDRRRIFKPAALAGFSCLILQRLRGFRIDRGLARFDAGHRLHRQIVRCNDAPTFLGNLMFTHRRAVFGFAGAANSRCCRRRRTRLLAQELWAQLIQIAPDRVAGRDSFFSLSTIMVSNSIASTSSQSLASAVKTNSSEPKLTPAAIGSKEGRESFSSSLISKNWAGAKKSFTGCVVWLVRPD